MWCRDEYMEVDYDSPHYHSQMAYEEMLGEEGLVLCYTCEKPYEEDLENCPTCEENECRRDEFGGCWACGLRAIDTHFMEQAVCWECYEALANGRHSRDTCTFANPGGNSALRAAGPGNPRVHPCPTCYTPNVLTPQDVARGYQCDSCADMAERGW